MSLSLTLSPLLQQIAWVRCVSASVSCVSELRQCGRDAHRQREDMCTDSKLQALPCRQCPPVVPKKSHPKKESYSQVVPQPWFSLNFPFLSFPWCVRAHNRLTPSRVVSLTSNRFRRLRPELFLFPFPGFQESPAGRRRQTRQHVDHSGP